MALFSSLSRANQAVRPLDVGAHVFTLDGVRLGKVCEVHPHYFKLDVSLKPDFWLGRDTVWSSDLSGVHVDFRRNELDDHRVDEPPEFAARAWRRTDTQS